MKSLTLSLLLICGSAFAHETSQPKKGNQVESLVKGNKKDRKKKVEMCHECGKPEVNCDCKGEEHRKSE